MTITATRDPRDSPTTAKPRLLFFHSLTSGRSRRAEGYLAQVLQRRHNHDTFTITRIEIEERSDLAERLRVVTVPTLLVVEGRRVKARLETVSGANAVEAFLAPWLKR